MGDRKQEFLSATQKLSGVLRVIVEISVREYHELGGVQFSRNSGLTVERGIRRMMKPVWEAYQEWLVSLGVKTRSEAERLWKGFGEGGDVQRSVQELLQAEEGYGALLKKVEADVQKQEGTVATLKRLHAHGFKLVSCPAPQSMPLLRLMSFPSWCAFCFASLLTVGECMRIESLMLTFFNNTYIQSIYKKAGSQTDFKEKCENNHFTH